MTKKSCRNPGTPLFTPDPDQTVRSSRMFSVLCVYDNPVFLDRIYRDLERNGDIFAEISISVEDALHLMVYLCFDVVVTDFTLWQNEKNGFLKTVRAAGNQVPFVYFTREWDAETKADALRYGTVDFIGWEEESPPHEFDELYISVKQAALTNRMKNNSGQGEIS
jgi:DNA-binding NtrC family response regulator